MKDTYICKKCREEWRFFPEDYEDTQNLPDICPLCAMPFTEMWVDVYKEEGIIGVITQTFKRIGFL